MKHQHIACNTLTIDSNEKEKDVGPKVARYQRERWCGPVIRCKVQTMQLGKGVPGCVLSAGVGSWQEWEADN